MTKVYPNASSSSSSSSPLPTSNSDQGKIVCGGDALQPALVLTVWKKSLLLSCEGFTVFDPRGNLVYRVDNYLAATKGHIYLMDAAGATLLTIRRRRLSLGETWQIFEGEQAENPRFTVRKNASLTNSRCLAHVSSAFQKKSTPVYEIEGSYARRCCAVYDGKRRRVAEIRQKEAAVEGVAFGRDVFRLEVQPEFEPAVAMAFVILLDQMYRNN